MKRFILFHILTLFSSWVIGQNLEIDKQPIVICQFGLFTQLTDSTFTGPITTFNDQLGESYSPLIMTTDWIILDGQRRFYTIDSIKNAGFNSADLWVKEVEDNDSPPLGVGTAYLPFPSNPSIVPVGPLNSEGIAPNYQAILIISNVAKLLEQNAIDSTRLREGNILVYYQNGVEIGRDTIEAGGGGTGNVDTAYVKSQVANIDINDYFLHANFRKDQPSLPADSITAETESFGFITFDSTRNRLHIFSRTGINTEASDGFIFHAHSDDFGETWSPRDTLYAEAGFDIRDPGGGVSANGDLTVFFSRAVQPLIAGAFKTLSYVRSTDGGITWSARTDLPFPSSTDGGSDFFAIYGKMEICDGDTLIKPLYRQTPGYEVYIIRSSDNGATWSDTINIVRDVNTDTETDIIYLGGRQVLAVARRDGAPHYRQYISLDNGLTWADQGNILIDTFTNISPVWLGRFTASNDSLMISMFYYDRSDPSGEQQMKVVYGRASDFKEKGINAWLLYTRTNIEYNTNSPGYPSAVHPYFNELSVGTWPEGNNIHFFSTPIRGKWNGAKLGLGGHTPVNDLDIQGAASIGYRKEEVTKQSTNTLHVKEGIIVNSVMKSSPAAALDLTWPFGGQPQIRLGYDDVVSTGLRTTNVGYFAITPTGERVGINTSNPLREFHIHGTPQPELVFSRSGLGPSVTGLEINFDISNVSNYRNVFGGHRFITPGTVSAGGLWNYFNSDGDFGLSYENIIDKRFHLAIQTNNYSGVNYEHRITHTADVPGNISPGFGVGMEFELENNGGTDELAGTLHFELVDTSAAGEDVDAVVRLQGNNVVAEKLRIRGNDGEIIAGGRFLTVDNPIGGTDEIQASLDSLYERTFTGWVEYVDTTYRSTDWDIAANDTVTLRMAGHSIRDMQIPLDLDSMFNRSDTTIIGRNGDGLSISIEFDVEPSTNSDTYFDLWIDIGGGVRPLYGRTTSLPKGNGVEHHFSYSYTGFTLDTWEANGGKVKMSPNANIRVNGDIVILLTRTHKAR